jgi:hypothetical protein
LFKERNAGPSIWIGNEIGDEASVLGVYAREAKFSPLAIFAFLSASTIFIASGICLSPFREVDIPLDPGK